MKISKRFFAFLACFSLLFLAPVKNDSLAACGSDPNADSVKVAGYAYTSTSIQDAYNYASTTLNLPSFTLQLAGEIFTENLTVDKGAVVLDGGWDCSFATKTSPSSVFGTITIKSTGSLIATTNTEATRVVSSNQSSFDRDGDGFTSIGSTSGSADDCNDNDSNTYPGAPEICDGFDNNCDGQVDEGLVAIDADGDGYYDKNSCGPVTDDCNDNDATINPGAVEIPYDGIDQDCNEVDLTFANGDTCVPCHDPDNLLNSAHNYRPTYTDTTCVICHAGPVSSILSGHYGRTVRTTDNGVAANSTINCFTCHDDGNHSGEFALGDGQGDVWNDVSPPYPGNYTCDNCHASRAARHATATAHNNRVIDGSCASCHTSDTSVLGSAGAGTLASAADVDTLHRSNCALCHNYSGTKLNAGIVRQAIQDGLGVTQVSCLDCHTDKGTGHGNFTHPIEVGPADLSYDAPGQLCSNCHVVANWAEIEGTEHNVATNGAGSCATCHNSSRQEVIDTIALGANPTIHCLDCHSDKDLTPHGSVDHMATNTSYVTGGTTFCLDCHDTGAAANATVTGTHNNNCTLCHTTVPFLQSFVPAGGGDCVTCHTVTWQVLHMTNPPDHSALVTTTGTDNCASCHADALIDASTHLSDCSNCHNASDGSLKSLAIGQTFTPGGNCETCHTDSWEVTHTTNTPDHGILVRVDGTSCAGCHNDPPPLTDNADPKVHDACASCHNTNGSLVTLYDTNLQSLVTGGNCANCHTTGFDSIHATSHTHTVAQGVGDLSFGAPGTLCSICHVVSTWAEIEAVEHNVATNGAGSCATCHNSPRQEVMTAIAAGADPTNCLACHPSKELTVHGNTDHVTSYVTLTSTCANCHDPGGTANATVDVTHGADCTLCHTTVPNLIFGVPAGGGDCATCHPATWATTHTSNTPDHSSLVTTSGTNNCANCHANALVDASTHLSDCSNCHNADGSLKTTLGTDDQTFATGGNCETCHTGRDWTDHDIDHESAGFVTLHSECTSCHAATMTAGQGFINPADDEKHNACTSCHAADGTQATGSGDCSMCHSGVTGDWSTHAEDHTIKVTSATGCASCHSATVDYVNFVDLANNLKHDNCYVCHDNTTKLATTAAGDCSQCHSSVTGDFSTHMTQNHNGQVTLQAECSSCHTATVDYANFVDAANSKKHDSCTVCHDASTNAPAAPAGDCSQCHTANYFDSHTHNHTVALGAGDLSNGTSCGVCHVVSTWAEIEGTEHNVATNGTGSCATCHNSSTQTVINVIGAGNATNCLDCHTDKTAAHGSPDHMDGLVTLTSPCVDCHDPGSAENATVDITHSGNCSLCHTASIPDLKSGLQAGTCATCHGGDVQTVHASCTSCHDEPPSGNTAPDRERAHSEHDVLGYGNVNPSCNACHSGANHYDGSTQVSISSSFDDESWGAPSFNGSTCSNTSCHGGQTTPSWSSGSLNVNTQCSSCHSEGRSEYNSWDSGEHDKHVNGENMSCTDCHSRSKLANGSSGNTHFSNLQTTTFELHPGLTVDGSDLTIVDQYGNPRELNWNNSSNTCNLRCHGKSHDSGDNW